MMKIESHKLMLEGPEGNLQVLLDSPAELSPLPYVAVNCHPHSLHGGTMTNKVVHTVSRSIASLGIPSIRFNFRGVDQSQGVYDEGQGEQQDLIAVADWMRQRYPESQLILSGFSFGAFVSAFASKSLTPSLLISVSPPIKRFDFSGFTRPACPWQVIMGDEDELIDYADVVEWTQSFADQPQLTTIVGASHFFHGKLVELREQVERIVGQHLQDNQ